MKKIDISKVKKTRDGSAVLELHRLEHFPPCTWAGVVEVNGEAFLETWTEEGKYFVNKVDSDLDLIESSPYDDWKEDDKVWVKDKRGHWIARHFSRVDEDGIPLVFRNGSTSFTIVNCQVDREIPVKPDGVFVDIRLASEFAPG